MHLKQNWRVSFFFLLSYHTLPLHYLPLLGSVVDRSDVLFVIFSFTLFPSISHLLTGSYHNYFNIYDIQGDREDALRIKLGRGPSRKSDNDLNADNIDFTRKVLHVAWHPQNDIVAVATNNNLYLYAADDDQKEDDGAA